MLLHNLYGAYSPNDMEQKNSLPHFLLCHLPYLIIDFSILPYIDLYHYLIFFKLYLMLQNYKKIIYLPILTACQTQSNLEIIEVVIPPMAIYILYCIILNGSHFLLKRHMKTLIIFHIVIFQVGPDKRFINSF